jgi:hypothetical protein
LLSGLQPVTLPQLAALNQFFGPALLQKLTPFAQKKPVKVNGQPKPVMRLFRISGVNILGRVNP